MNLKTLSAVALGASLVVAGAGAAKADSYKPADQFHWSTPVVDGNFRYDGKMMSLPMAQLSSEAQSFISACNSEVRVRGFMGYNKKMQWDKAEFLCGKLSVGGDTPIAFNSGKEIKFFGSGSANTLPECQPFSGSQKRIWTYCGAVGPNDGTAKVLIGDGRNAGMTLDTDDVGSGIDTVEPILFPEVDQMRIKIFRERVESGYYNK